MIFTDRRDAGQKLAKLLEPYKNSGAIVYALPRGGVVVGYEIAKELNLPLNLIIVRKIGHPFNPEFAVCATDEEGHLLCNNYDIDQNWLEGARRQEQKEAGRRRERYLANRKQIDPAGRIAILVDDGAATGLTFRLAIRNLREKNPAKIVAALPVLPRDVANIIKKEADELVAIKTDDRYLGAVGAYYQNFNQVSDEEVVELVNASKHDY